MTMRMLLPIALLAVPLAWPQAAIAAPGTVYGVRYDEARRAIVISASGPLPFSTARLTGPHRLVIDMPGFKFGPSYQELRGVPGTPVTQIRGGQYKTSTARVVLNLDRAADFPITRAGNELFISLTPSAAPAPRRLGAQAPSLRAPSPAQITDVRFEGGALTVGMTRRAPYWSHTHAGSPARYTLVFPDVQLDDRLHGAAVGVGRDGVQRWRARQAGPDARIELDLDQAPRFNIRHHAQGWTFSLPRVAARKPVVPAVPDSPLTLRKVGRQWQLQITAPERFSYQISPEGEDRLVLSLTGARPALPRDSVYVDNGLIARVRMAPETDNQARLTLDFDQPVRFSASASADQRTLQLALSRVERDRVTVDPGHGGADHGARGSKGTSEKDVTFAIAKRLSRMMEASGMSVQMTRLKDVEILLRPRVEMANRNESDLYISIHANSYGNKAVRGVETYYFHDASRGLAKAIQKHLVASLKAPDRGVRKNNFYVVNHARMPAALVEIGYLTNPQEEALLRDAAYQERAARAIFDGIQEYMKTRGAKP